jgi:hypothetical protein
LGFVHGGDAAAAEAVDDRLVRALDILDDDACLGFDSPSKANFREPGGLPAALTSRLSMGSRKLVSNTYIL